MAQTPITGGCCCGQVRYTATQPPSRGSYCHCAMCRRTSGTGHGAYAMFPKTAVRFMGRRKTYVAIADSGNEVTRTFCPECGSPLTFETPLQADALFIAAGSLDDPKLFKPTVVIHPGGAPDWDIVDPALPRFQASPLRRQGNPPS